MKENYGILLVFPEEGGVQQEIYRQDVVEIDGDEVPVAIHSTGIILSDDTEVAETLAAFRREAIR